MSSATFVETHNAREGGARAPHKNFKALQSRERIRREFPFEELEKKIGSAPQRHQLQELQTFQPAVADRPPRAKKGGGGSPLPPPRQAERCCFSECPEHTHKTKKGSSHGKRII